MSSSRRDFLRGAALTTLGIVSAGKLSAQHQHETPEALPDKETQPTAARTASNGRFLPVETPDVPMLSYSIENGVKVFHLVAEVVKQDLVPGKQLIAWGYNGHIPGPAIEVFEGDRVRIVVENKLPEPTSMHWHGLEVPLKMDGVPGISQPLIMPGETFVYEFTLHQKGTFFYHSHMPMQEMMG